MSKVPFQLTEVVPLTEYKLRLRYADGQSFEIDLNDWTTETATLSPLKDHKRPHKAVRWAQNRVHRAYSLRSTSFSRARSK